MSGVLNFSNEEPLGVAPGPGVSFYGNVNIKRA
jgi:hypothetical protein